MRSSRFAIIVYCLLATILAKGWHTSSASSIAEPLSRNQQHRRSAQLHPNQLNQEQFLDSDTLDKVTQSDEEWQIVKKQLAASLDETLTLELGKNYDAKSLTIVGGANDVRSSSSTRIEQRSAIKQKVPIDDEKVKEKTGERAVIEGRLFSESEKQVGGEQQVAGKREPPLAHQLSDQLITNNEPVFVTGGTTKLDTSHVSRHLESLSHSEELLPEEAIMTNIETRKLITPRASEEVSTISRDFYKHNTVGEPPQDQSAPINDGNIDDNDAGLALQSDSSSELVTCSPDYEDQPTIMIDPPTNGANLTAEQQAQLLSGSGDSLGLQHNASATGMPQLNQPHCLPPGSRMIEVITKIITPILFGIIIVVGLLGNIIVMLVILEDRKTERELTPTNLLILDLSLADLSFIVFCIPFTGWDYAVGHWVFGQFWCKCNQYLIVVCALSSIYTLVLMSIDRFLAIVYPIECMNYRTSKNMLHAIYIKWFLILIIAFPTITVHGLVESPLGPEQYNCRFLSDQYNPLQFQIVFFVTSYLSPLILIFCLYLSLLNKLWFGAKPHGHKESHKMLESKKRVTWLVASIVIVFALCWCPIQIMLILMRLKTHKITATYVAIQVFAHILGYMNSCINPIVYAFASETFNQSFKRSWFGRTFWRCLQTCCCCCTSCFKPAPNLNPHGGFSGAVLGGASRSMSLANANLPITNINNNNNHLIRSNNNSLGTSAQMSQPRNKSLNHIFSPQAQAVNNGSSGRSDISRLDNGNTSRLPGERFPPDVNNDQFVQNSTTERVCTGNIQLTTNQRAICSKQPLPLEPRDRPILPLNTSPLLPLSAPRCEIDTKEEATRSVAGNQCMSVSSASSATGSSQTPSSSVTSFCENASSAQANVCSSGSCSKLTSIDDRQNQPQQQQQQRQQLVARMIQTSSSSQHAFAHECEPCTDATGNHCG